jgi:hypothetical protein
MVHNGGVAGSHRLKLNSALIHLAKRIKFSASYPATSRRSGLDRGLAPWRASPST